MTGPTGRTTADMSGRVRVAVIGVEHRHALHSFRHMLDAGASGAGWWTDGDPGPAREFASAFPDVPRAADRRFLLDDPSIGLVIVADVPHRRAALSIEAIRAGKHVLCDKPGCLSLDEVAELRHVSVETGRFWAIDFSERHQRRCVEHALALVRRGEIGRVVQIAGTGPHRLNAASRPSWFFDPSRAGGILCDLATHQIDQFLAFAAADDVEIVSASVGNFANPARPDFCDYGDLTLRSASVHGHFRVDWLTPDAMPVWGDCRLTVLGTEGTIELRKYVDVGGRPGGDHVLLVNRTTCGRVEPDVAPPAFHRRLIEDVIGGTRTAEPEGHSLRVSEIAIRAQAAARRI